MEKQQALTIVKQALDKATESGVFKNLETVVTISQALQKIVEELQKPAE
jgi:hypothetical protein